MFAARQTFGFFQKRAFSASARQVRAPLAPSLRPSYIALRALLLTSDSTGLQGRRPWCRWWHWPASLSADEAEPSRHSARPL